MKVCKKEYRPHQDNQTGKTLLYYPQKYHQQCLPPPAYHRSPPPLPQDRVLFQFLLNPLLKLNRRNLQQLDHLDLLRR